MTQNSTEDQRPSEDRQHSPESLKHRKWLILLTAFLILIPLVLMTLRLISKI